MQKTRHGSLQIMISSAFFGALPLLTRIGYAGGANAVTLLAIRFTLASVLIWAYLFWTRTQIRTNLKQLAVFATVAICGYGVMASSYFNSIRYIPSSMSAMIMFTYPVIVTYIAAVFLKAPITRTKVVALILVTAGAVVMSQGSLVFDLRGIGLALISSFAYAMYITYLGSPFTYQQESKVLTAFIITFSAIFFLCSGALRGELTFSLTPSAWIAVSVMAVFSTVLAIMIFYSGVQKLGPSLSAIVSTVEPLTALLLGVVVLRERIGAMQWLGAVLIVLGVLYVQIPARKPKIDWKARIR